MTDFASTAEGFTIKYETCTYKSICFCNIVNYNYTVFHLERKHELILSNLEFKASFRFSNISLHTLNPCCIHPSVHS